jgi:Fe-S-cluster containining protein
MASRFRLAILGESPCFDCRAVNCCRQNGHEYAVLLEESEHARFRPFAIDIPIMHGGSRFIEKVLPYRDGRCQFLGDDNRCLIYEDRPINCRRFQCIDYYHHRGATPGEHGQFLIRNPDVREMLDSM